MTIGREPRLPESRPDEQPEDDPAEQAPVLDDDEPTEERDDLAWRRPLRPRPLHLWW